MSVNDITQVVIYLVSYCAPAAFIINLTSWGARVIIYAATGKIMKGGGLF